MYGGEDEIPNRELIVWGDMFQVGNIFSATMGIASGPFYQLVTNL